MSSSPRPESRLSSQVLGEDDDTEGVTANTDASRLRLLVFDVGVVVDVVVSNERGDVIVDVTEAEAYDDEVIDDTEASECVDICGDPCERFLSGDFFLL